MVALNIKIFPNHGKVKVQTLNGTFNIPLAKLKIASAKWHLNLNNKELKAKIENEIAEYVSTFGTKRQKWLIREACTAGDLADPVLTERILNFAYNHDDLKEQLNLSLKLMATYYKRNKYTPDQGIRIMNAWFDNVLSRYAKAELGKRNRPNFIGKKERFAISKTLEYKLRPDLHLFMDSSPVNCATPKQIALLATQRKKIRTHGGIIVGMVNINNDKKTFEDLFFYAGCGVSGDGFSFSRFMNDAVIYPDLARLDIQCHYLQKYHHAANILLAVPCKIKRSYILRLYNEYGYSQKT